MANVKFNKYNSSPTVQVLGENPLDQITFVRDTNDNKYNSVYLGTHIVGAGLLGLIKPEKLITPNASGYTNYSVATDGPCIISGDSVNGTPTTTARKIIASNSFPVDLEDLSDYEILTAKASKNLSSALSENTFYTNGVRSVEANDSWKYTFADGAGTGHAFNFVLPVTNTVTNSDSLLPTSGAVSRVISSLYNENLMRFSGYLSSDNDEDLYAKEPWSVFLVSQEFKVATADSSSEMLLEVGDLVVLTDHIDYDEKLTLDKCFVIERNLTNAITYDGSLSGVNFLMSTNEPNVVTNASNVTWDRVARASGQSSDSITVTSYTNNVSQNPVTITIDNVGNSVNSSYVGSTQATGSDPISILVLGAANGNTGRYSTKFCNAVTITPSTGELSISYSGGSTTENINVAQSILDLRSQMSSVVWNDLSSQ